MTSANISGQSTSANVTGPGTPRRDQAARTERQLLDAARRVFVDRGYRRATVAAITDRAETAHGTFYLYFKNKDDVFSRIMTEATDVLFEEAEAGWKPSPVEGVRTAVHGYLTAFVQHVELWRCLLEAAFVNPEIEARWAEVRAKFVDRIARSLRAQVEAGNVRPLDPDLSAQALGAMVEWFAYSAYVLGVDADSASSSAPTAERLDAAVDQLTDLWVHAVHGSRFDQ